MSQDKVFADGFLFKRRENAPEFVIGNISVKVEEAVAFFKHASKKRMGKPKRAKQPGRETLH
jgi:hypothetical protein